MKLKDFINLVSKGEIICLQYNKGENFIKRTYIAEKEDITDIKLWFDKEVTQTGIYWYKDEKSLEDLAALQITVSDDI